MSLDSIPASDLAGAFLPETKHEAFGITKRRDPQGSLGIRSLDDLAALGFDLLNDIVDAIDVDVGQQTWLA